MLQPSRTKFRRPQRLSYEGLAKGGTDVSFGDIRTFKSLEDEFTKTNIGSAFG